MLKERKTVVFKIYFIDVLHHKVIEKNLWERCDSYLKACYIEVGVFKLLVTGFVMDCQVTAFDRCVGINYVFWGKLELVFLTTR
jgi:hypothetical protein